MAHVTANLAFEAQGLFFGGFGEFFLQRETLSTVAFFFSGVVAFTFCHGAAFACLVQRYGVSLMLFTFGAVSGYFFRNVHVFTFQRTNKIAASSYTFSALQPQIWLLLAFAGCFYVTVKGAHIQLLTTCKGLLVGFQALPWHTFGCNQKQVKHLSLTSNRTKQTITKALLASNRTINKYCTIKTI